MNTLVVTTHNQLRKYSRVICSGAIANQVLLGSLRGGVDDKLAWTQQMV